MSKNIENKYFIKNSDSVFRKIFEIHDSIMMLIESETGIIIDVNNSAVNFYGYSKSEFSSMTIYDIINMPKEQAYQEMQKSINKEHKSMIFRHRLAGGDIREVEVHSSVIDNDARRLILLMIYDLSKRNFAEEALAFEKSRLSEIIKGTNVGTWEWNVRTGETIFNDRWAAIIGYTLEEISPVSINTWMKYVHPDDSKISDDLLELHFKGELDYYDCEVRMKHKNGQWVWILDRGRVYIWDDDGKPLLMSGTHQDITHRKYAEEKLKQSEQKLSAYINSSPLGIFIVNDIGIFEEVNPAGARMLGYSEKELVNYNITHVIDISSQEKAKEHFRTVQIEGSSESEHLLKRKNGTKFWGFISVVKLYDNRQIAFVQDINSRKKADDLLNQTRQNYETFFNTIDELLLVIDEKSNIIHANKTVYNRLGFSKGEIIGKSVLNIHPVERRGEASRIVNEMLIGKANSCPIPLINKFGVQIPVETRVVYGNWDGKPAIFVISKDITQVKLSEEKFSKVFYINPSACGLSDLITGEYIEVNEAFYQLFGFDKNEVIGKTSTELGIWTNEARKALLLRADIDGNVTNIETTLKTKNGDIKHVLISSENIYIQDKSYRYTVVHDISESKKAEAAIRKSETKYRKLFENMTNGFSLNEVIIDDNNKPIDIRLIEANQFYKDFTGLNAVDIKGKTIRELMPDIDMNIFNKYFSVALTGEPAVLEYFSKIFNKHVNVNIYSPEKGFFATIFEDISERKIIENKLKESEEKYRLLIENSGDGILFTNPEGYIYSANPEACRILGRTEEEICSIGRSGIIDVNDPILPIAIAERERTGKFVGELTFVRGDGTLFPGELSSTIFIDSEGNKRTSMIIRDISERKLAEESLKDSRAKYQAIFESTGTATLIVDEDTTINMANNECYSMTGYTAAELIGQRWTRFVAPESLELMIKNHNLRRQNPEAAPKKYEVKLINKNGEIRDGLLDIGIIPGTKKSIVSILDITERKRAEEEIKQKNTEFAELNASKDKFFSIIAHDLRSPFSGFIGIIKMMSDNFIDFSLNELQEISKSMMVSANNLYQLLENLLEWSSMQRDAKGFNPVLTTIDTIVKESMVFSDKLAKQKDIVLKSNVPEDIRITADISMLNSVFRNLISNAIKFTARGGRVEVGLLSKLSDDIKSAHNSKLNNESRLSDDLKSSDTSDYCTIFIKDSGIGMNQDTLSGLFKLDTKVSNFGTEGEPSTGLGLLLCKEFIQKHGGMIWAESEEGKGSTFYFTLPIGESQNKK